MGSRSRVFEWVISQGVGLNCFASGRELQPASLLASKCSVLLDLVVVQCLRNPVGVGEGSDDHEMRHLSGVGEGGQRRSSKLCVQGTALSVLGIQTRLLLCHRMT